MIITHRTCFTFKIPDEVKAAEKFRKDNPEATEVYDMKYRSFVITNTYVVETKKGKWDERTG